MKVGRSSGHTWGVVIIKFEVKEWIRIFIAYSLVRVF